MTPKLQFGAVIPLGNKGGMKDGCESVLNRAYVNMEGIPSRLGTITINLFILRLCQEAAVLTDDMDLKTIMTVSQRSVCTHAIMKPYQCACACES